MSRTFIALDFETTGLSSRDAIIEIGAVKFKETGEILDIFQTLANPGIPISISATAVHGIRKCDIQGAPKPQQAWDKFLAWAGDDFAAFVAHNASFEVRFIQALYGGAAQTPRLPFVDTLALARKYLPGRPSYRLASLIKDWSGASHRAQHDADACARLMCQIIATRSFGKLPSTAIQIKNPGGTSQLPTAGKQTTGSPASEAKAAQPSFSRPGPPRSSPSRPPKPNQQPGKESTASPVHETETSLIVKTALAQLLEMGFSKYDLLPLDHKYCAATPERNRIIRSSILRLFPDAEQTAVATPPAERTEEQQRTADRANDAIDSVMERICAQLITPPYRSMRGKRHDELQTEHISTQLTTKFVETAYAQLLGLGFSKYDLLPPDHKYCTATPEQSRIIRSSILRLFSDAKQTAVITPPAERTERQQRTADRVNDTIDSVMERIRARLTPQNTTIRPDRNHPIANTWRESTTTHQQPPRQPTDNPPIPNTSPTQDQLDHIRRLGGNPYQPTTKQQASQYIGALQARMPRKPANSRRATVSTDRSGTSAADRKKGPADRRGTAFERICLFLLNHPFWLYLAVLIICAIIFSP